MCEQIPYVLSYIHIKQLRPLTDLSIIITCEQQEGTIDLYSKHFNNLLLFTAKDIAKLVLGWTFHLFT